MWIRSAAPELRKTELQAAVDKNNSTVYDLRMIACSVFMHNVNNIKFEMTKLKLQTQAQVYSEDFGLMMDYNWPELVLLLLLYKELAQSVLDEITLLSQFLMYTFGKHQPDPSPRLSMLIT